MAVEIVGEDSSLYKETSCSNCASKLRYTNSDKKSYQKRDYRGGVDIYHYIDCPKCSEKVYV